MKPVALFFCLFTFPCLFAGTYYIRTDGNDSNNGLSDSSSGAWLTIGQAITILAGTGPHTVYLGSGEFAFPNGVGSGPSDQFSDWVEFVGTGGGSTTITGSWELGGNGGQYYGANHEGTWDAYIRFDAITFDDEVNVYGARYLEFNNCLFNLPTPLVGSAALIDRTAVNLRGGRYQSIDNCEFTQVTTAITIRVWDSEITNCHIHDIAHDGIRVVGSVNLLIDNCDIYNLDDGVDDVDETWSRHCDAIHFFMQTDDANSVNNGVTVSNCRLYNSESQGVQFNNKSAIGTYHNQNITFFNNIFGQTVANAFNGADQVDGFKFYNNTFILSQDSNSFESEYRTVVCDNITFTLSAHWTGVEIYNNLLTNVPPTWGVHDLVSNNIYQGRSVSDFQTAGGGKNAIFTTVNQFLDDDAFTGIPIAGYLGKNLGSKLNRNGDVQTAVPSLDHYGSVRDNRPDIGAYEFGGESPQSESVFAYLDDVKTVYIDDFLDGDSFEDIELGSVAGHRGIAWSPVNDSSGLSAGPNYTYRYDHADVRVELQAAQETAGPYFLLASNVPSTLDFEIDYACQAGTSSTDDGVLLFYKDGGNYIWVSLTRTDAGTALYQVVGGVQSVLDSLSGFELGNQTNHIVNIDASVVGSSMSLAIDLDGGDQIFNGSYDISAFGTMGGGIGLVRDSAVANHRMQFSAYQVTLNDGAPPAANPPGRLSTRLNFGGIGGRRR